jgi:small subunit ribosomal protein S4
MSKNLDPKCKQCRRAGEKLFLKGDRCQTAKCAVVKRNYPPGAHGAKNKRRMTDYGTQLNEKQKAKRQYNMLEKQFRLTFEKASKKSGNVGEVFLQLLESRFDNMIYRLGFADSRSQARQMINHGLFMVNGRKLTIPSCILKTGDVVKIKTNKQSLTIFKSYKEKMKKKEVPGWLNYNQEDMSAKVLHLPTMDLIKPNFNIQMIVEYYSR